MNRRSRELARLRPWSVLLLGAFHEHAVLLIFGVAFLPVLALIAIGPGRLDGIAELLLVVLALALSSGYARHFIWAPIARWLKRIVPADAQIAYFRSFDPQQSRTGRDVIGPILGSIGRLTTIHNEDYIQGLTDIEGHSQSEDTWFTWLELGEILGDGLSTIEPEGEWQSAVLNFLADSDLAIIDVSVWSENIAWELARAREYLPDGRIILIAALNNKINLEAEEVGATEVITYDTSPRGRRRFRRALRQRLASQDWV